MGNDFDYGFDLNTFVESEFARYDGDSYSPDGDTDVLLREFDDWDEEYVEFDDEVYDL